MSMKNLFLVSRCAALVAALGAMTALPVCAQQSGLNPASSPLLMAATASPGLADSSSQYSSSADSTALTPAEERGLFRFSDKENQPPPRRRYGRPTYHDAGANADGSRRYTFSVGGGFGIPEGTQSDYLTTSYGLQVAGGRNFNEHLALLLRVAYDHFGMTGDTISNQSVLYFNDPSNSNGLDANSHIWSISLDPVYNLHGGGNMGAYITGGVGFYHKVANFTLPQTGETCDYYYGCYYFTANSNVDHYMSNAPGFDGGFGLTYKLSRFSSEQLFAEFRYVYMKNQYKPGANLGNVGTYGGNNYFPQNSQTTAYFPVKFGIRW